MDRFVPYILRDRIKDEFDRLDQGSMTIIEYEVNFNALSRYYIANIAIESEKIEKFVNRLDTTF